MKSLIDSLLLRPFELPGVSLQAFERNVAFCRILFGIGIVHRAVDILGAAAAAADPSLVEFHCAIQIGLGLLFILGLRHSGCSIIKSAFQIGLVLPGAVVVLLRIPMQEDRCVPIRWICESGRSSTAMPG